MIFSLLLSTFVSAQTPCGAKIQGFSLYEDLENGRIVEKHSIYPLTDWSDASAFDGIVTHKSGDQKFEMSFELRPSLTSQKVRSWTFQFAPWHKDSKYLYAKDFPPAELMEGARGVYSVTLKSGKKAICKETHGISIEGSNP